MAERLDLNEFKTIQFYHHPLITDELGNKISKSTGSLTQSPFDFTASPMGVKQSFSRWQFEKGLSAE
jgi:glutamyl/glutaminyl-tRNA synthetase